MANEVAAGLVAEQTRLMGCVASSWIPRFEELCCSPCDDPSSGPAERLSLALAPMASIVLHDEPYELAMPDGGVVVIAEGKQGHSGMYLQDDGTTGMDVIHCASAGRKNNAYRRRHFTVLHEIGHMVQNRDRTLSRRLRTQRVMDRHDFEERCCDGFAAQSLLPDGLVARYAAWPFDADDLLALYTHSFASREAVAHRVASLMPVPGSITVCNSRGYVTKVVESSMGGCDLPPAGGEHGRSHRDGMRTVVRHSSAGWFDVRYLDAAGIGATGVQEPVDGDGCGEAGVTGSGVVGRNETGKGKRQRKGER